MSDNWVVQNLQNALETWNEKLAEIWTLVTQSPQSFKGGSIWNVMVGIHGAVQAVGLALVVLFFVMGVMKTCGSFADLKRPEVAIKVFVRFAKIHYRFQGQMCSCKDIFRSCKHRRGRSRYLLSVPVEICGEDDDAATIAAKLVFVRNRSNRKDYLVLLSTDTSLTEDEIIQLYGKRWDIEVFFKTCKSVLKLTKECRSLSYDAMCAQTAIVFMRYLFLAVGVREDSDLRSSVPLFCLAADEIADISFASAFEKLQLFLQKLLEGFIAGKEEIRALVMDFLAGLPADMKRFLDFEGLMGTSAPEMGCEV